MPKKDGTPTAAEQRLAAAAADQHPALVDDDATDAQRAEGERIEIAKRSQDEDSATATEHVKKFVVLASAWSTTLKDGAHRHNIEATRQAMIGQGLRPTGAGRFVGSEEHPDGASLVLTYAVPCTPAVVATDEHVAHAHVTLADQRAAEEGGDGEPDLDDDPDPDAPQA